MNLLKSKNKIVFFAIGLVIVLSLVIVTVLMLQPKPFKDYSGDGVQVIACIGDSITVSGRVGADVSKTYPGLLEAKLGSQYQVNNYGLIGNCLQKSAEHSYWDRPAFIVSQELLPDVVIIMLGTNDSKNDVWNVENFTADAEAMVRVYQNLASAPKVYLMKPPAVFQVNGKDNVFGVNANIVANEVGPILELVAQKTGVTVIDIYAATKDHPEYTDDGVHPNVAGIAAIADTIYAAFK